MGAGIQVVSLLLQWLLPRLVLVSTTCIQIFRNVFKNDKFELIYSTYTGTLLYIELYKNFQFIKVDLSVQYIIVPYGTILIQISLI